MLDSLYTAAQGLPTRQHGPHYCWLTLLIFVLAGCRAGHYYADSLPTELQVPPTNNSDQINLENLSGLGSGSTVIGPGDLVSITISSGRDEQKLRPTLARVSENGHVNVPMVGEVPIAGTEPFEAGERIAAACVERGLYLQPSVVLKVDEPAVNRVTVLGAVVEPGVQKLPRGSSDVLSAVAAAGGFSKKASTKVEVMRQHSPAFMAKQTQNNGVVQASYDQPSAAGLPITPEPGQPSDGQTSLGNQRSYRLDLAQANPSHQKDYQIGDGDVVMVLPEKERVIHVSGLVNTPNQFKIPRNQDVHVLDAIAMAGGIKSPVADKVYVIRRVQDQAAPVVIQVSLASAKKNGPENLRLAAGDLVSVEATPTTHFVDTVTTLFNVGLGLGGNVTMF